MYFIYGMHWCVNAVTREHGLPSAVLVRALEPLEGIDAMRRNRGFEKLLDLARGPGRLAAAMRITLTEDGADLCGAGALWLGTPIRKPGDIVAATRIGITKEAERPLRFFERGNRFVSGPRRLIGANACGGE